MDKRQDPRLAYLLVNLATLLWASNIVIGRALRGQIGPLTLTGVRFTIAGLVLWVLMRRQNPSERRPGSRWYLLAGMGLTGAFGFSTLLYLSLNFTTASNAALINGMGPLMTAILAGIFLGEKLNTYQITGALVSLLGVGLVIAGGQTGTFSLQSLNLGDLLMLLGVALWGLYSILGRLAMQDRSALAATAVSTWMALPLLVPGAALEWWDSPQTITPWIVLAAVYIGIFPSVVAFLAWNAGVRLVGPSRSMAFYNMIPVFGVILGVFVLGERLSWLQVAGGGLVLAGGLASVWEDLRS